MKSYTDLEKRLAEANGMTVEQMMGSENKTKKMNASEIAERITELEDALIEVAELIVGGAE